MSLMSLNITLVLRRYNKRMSLVCQIAIWLHCIYANKDGKIVEKFNFIDTKSKHMQCCSLLQECQILNLKDTFHMINIPGNVWFCQVEGYTTVL